MNFLIFLSLFILPIQIEPAVDVRAERVGMAELNGSFFLRIMRKPPNPWQWTFPYSTDQLCTIRRHLNHGIFFQLDNVFTLERSASIELLLDHSITELRHLE